MANPPLIPLVTLLEHLGDVDPSDVTEGYVLTRQPDGSFAFEAPVAGGAGGDHDHPEYALAADVAAASNNVVVPPAVTVSEGPPPTISTTYTFGITAGGDPYYNSAGVTAGDEAVLVISGDTYALRKVNP